ncbi:hypothetical protein SISNIDRAFT_510742 [Sistotremastrum niveocremeum HHB9708]|uniref:Arrestin-like N-terminal domain-containing protein n=1 Tax=Sistotremastrum niveocremeum HHB9708 TaxID=1314777 RepID=A0A164TKY6_9AGAM|nr:hypothetical protein SISNIDRAFT_510742 [Sistotremastrum niveocremeum HHB9708]
MGKEDLPPATPPATGDGKTDHELPGYSSARTDRGVLRSEHVYTLETGSKPKAWLLLKVNSKAKDPKSLPLFFDNDKITGKVELDLEKTEHIQGVTLTVSETLQVGQDPVPFYSQVITLWSTEMGDPKNPTPVPEVGGSKSKVKAASPKLKGTYSWDFSITLPEETQASDTPKGPKRTFPLPPSFTERGSAAYVDYKLTVTIKRGSFRVDNTLATSVAHYPRRRPPPPSDLQRASYIDGGQMVGPDADPAGWKVLPPVKIQGTLFDTKQVEVEVSLALGTPLIFSLNSPVPLWITLKSADPQLLDLLSTPSSFLIRLKRTLAVGPDASDNNREERSDTTFPQVAGRGIVWPLSETQGSAETSAAGGERVLQGEVNIAATTKISFVFPRVSLRYAVELLPFAAAGFTTTAPPGVPLISQHIEVVTDPVEGLPPRSRAPPGYVAKAEAEYDNAIGVLTAANQRFLHFHQSMG